MYILSHSYYLLIALPCFKMNITKLLVTNLWTPAVDIGLVVFASFFGHVGCDADPYLITF
jgi:hypothetical protein